MEQSEWYFPLGSPPRFRISALVSYVAQAPTWPLASSSCHNPLNDPHPLGGAAHLGNSQSVEVYGQTPGYPHVPG
jgi:hypothetical protein